MQDRQKRAILQPQAMTRPVLATTTLWINGLSTDTKAADLKTLFIKYGKVWMALLSSQFDMYLEWMNKN